MTAETLIALRSDLAAAESKSENLAKQYGVAFALYNHQRDIVMSLRNRLAAGERELLDAIK
jgi:hypothetical protein